MNARAWLALSVLVAGITWLYAGKILRPWDQRWGEAHDGIKSQMGDLYSPWVGTRELLLRHRNPYGPEVSHDIQMAFYGHPVSQTYHAPGAVTNEQRFAYPLYVVFLLAPTVYADFADLRRWAELAFALLTGISVLMCLDILRWRLRWEAAIAVIVFVLSSPQIVQGLRFDQLALLVGFLLIAAAHSIRRHHLPTAGALLALSTIKPQMTVLALCWFAIWIAGDWSKRWRLAAGFLGTLASLITAGELLLPGWIGHFIAGVAAYRRYASPSSLLRVALGDTLGEILGGLIILALLIFGWANRKKEADSQEFTLVFAAFLMGTLLAFPLLTPFNQVLLILPALLLLRDWNTLPRLSRFVFTVGVSWPWITSSVLLIFSPRVDPANQLALLPSFLVLFFPIFLPLLLMTRRGTAAWRIAATDSRLA